MGKLTGFIAAAVLMFGMGAVNAGETPQILGAADYQALSTSEMSSITGEHKNGHRHRHGGNRNTNVNVAQGQGCGSTLAQNCAQALGGDAIAGSTITIILPL